MTVIDSFEEEFVERKTRTIEVTEEVQAKVEAWHGGRLVATLSAWTCAASAGRDAAEAADRFGVDAASTMRIRVSETLTRYWSDRTARDRDGQRQPRVVSRRHVRDAVSGALGVRPARLRVVARAWLGLPAGTDPTPFLACYRDVHVDGMDGRLLFEGYGHGPMRHAPPRIVEPDSPPPRDERGVVFHAIRIEGALEASVPTRDGAPSRLAGGGLYLSTGIDFAVARDWSVRPYYIDDVRGPVVEVAG